MKRKVLSVLLAITMTVSMVPQAVMAATAQQEQGETQAQTADEDAPAEDEDTAGDQTGSKEAVDGEQTEAAAEDKEEAADAGELAADEQDGKATEDQKAAVTQPVVSEVQAQAMMMAEDLPAAGTAYDSWEAAKAAGLNEGDTVTIGGIEYTYGGDKSKSAGIWLSLATGNTIYQAGEGYLAYDAETYNVVLHNAVLEAEADANGTFINIGGKGTSIVTLEGTNSIQGGQDYSEGRYTPRTACIINKSSATTNPYTSIQVIGREDSKLTTTGTTAISAATITIQNANLDISYGNCTSGIGSAAGDVTITDSEIVLKSVVIAPTGGSGAIYANDVQTGTRTANLNITNSTVVAIDTTGNALNAVTNINCKDSRVIAKASAGYAMTCEYISLDGGDTYIEGSSVYSNLSKNGARIYYSSNKNYAFQMGSNIQYGNCSYDQATGKITVGAGYNGNTYMYGTVIWSDQYPSPPSGQIAMIGAAQLTVPEGVTMEVPKITCGASGTVTNNGIINVANEILSYGTLSGEGTYNAVITTVGKKKIDSETSVNAYSYTAKGDKSYNPALFSLGQIERDGIIKYFEYLTIDEGANYTIPENVTLDASGKGITKDNLSEYLSSNGTIINNGTIKLPDGCTKEQVEALNITGDGDVLYRKPLEEADIVLDTDSFAYNEKSQTPAITIDGATVDATSTLYELTYSNSNGGADNTTNIGTVTITITAKDVDTAAYIGTTTKTYKIFTVDITKQPVSPASINVGYTTAPTLSVTAKADPSDMAISYQWYKDNTAIGKATEANYTVEKGLSDGTHTYYCVVTCGDQIIKSDSAVVKVTKQSTGWIQDANGRRYIHANGSYTSNNWEVIDGKWYYFGTNGYMKSGWQKISGKWYYFGAAADGAMKSGWQKISGKWYYLGSAKDGAMKNGWQKINNKWYYLGANTDGAMKIGWQRINSKWYYFGNNADDGAMKIGWQMINGKWYYLSSSFSDGAMKTGWQKISGKWYYLTVSDGAMKTGWQKIGKYWYYFGAAGDGAMKTGWQKVNGKWYYMYKENAPVGHMAASTHIGKYYVNASGVWVS